MAAKMSVLRLILLFSPLSGFSSWAKLRGYHPQRTLTDARTQWCAADPRPIQPYKPKLSAFLFFVVEVYGFCEFLRGGMNTIWVKKPNTAEKGYSFPKGQTKVSAEGQEQEEG